MTRYVIDTNLYIRATRDNASRVELERFVLAFAPELYLHAVVGLELLTGATSPDLESRTRANILTPFETRGRVITPTYTAWTRAGAALATAARKKDQSRHGHPSIPGERLPDCCECAGRGVCADHGQRC